MKKHQKKRTYKIILAIMIVLVIASCVIALLRDTNGETKTPGQSAITKSEKAEVNANKARIGSQNVRSSDQAGVKNPGSDTTGTTNVIITSSQSSNGMIVVSSYVPGVFEDGGTCTLTLSNGKSTVKRTTIGISDANHTTCPTFTIDNTGHSALSSGTWQVNVAYSSSKHIANSLQSILMVE